MTQTRRDFIRMTTAVGTAAWVVPSIVSRPAVASGSPPPPPCPLTARATGLVFDPGGSPTTFGDTGDRTQETPRQCSPVSVQFGSGTINGGAACGEVSTSAADGGYVDSKASLAKVDIVLASPPTQINVGVLTTDVRAFCDCRPAASTVELASLMVNGSFIDVAVPPNTVVFDSGGVSIIFHRQVPICAGGKKGMASDALFIQIPAVGVIEIGHAEATTSCGGC